jgi:hypothetical protein
MWLPRNSLNPRFRLTKQIPVFSSRWTVGRPAASAILLMSVFISSQSGSETRSRPFPEIADR